MVSILRFYIDRKMESIWDCKVKIYCLFGQVNAVFYMFYTFFIFFVNHDYYTSDLFALKSIYIVSLLYPPLIPQIKYIEIAKMYTLIASLQTETLTSR